MTSEHAGQRDRQGEPRGSHSVELPRFPDTDPDAFASLIDLDAEQDEEWSEEDLADILRHQLAAPLSEMELEGVAARRQLDEWWQDGFSTFGAVLFHPDPPLDPLRCVKTYAKSLRGNPDLGVPSRVTMVLYFAAIVIARRRHGESITSLDSKAVDDGIRWVLSLPWIDEELRDVLGPPESS